MSQHAVGVALDALLTDEDLRTRFSSDPIEALVDLGIRGIALTPAEVDVLIRIDRHLWAWTDDVVAGQVH